MLHMKKLLLLDNIQAKNFFIKEENYCSIDLPQYFSFNKVLAQANAVLEKKKTLANCIVSKQALNDADSKNYKFYSNKDGNYAWRPFEIIHPFLYVDLVNQITEKDNWEYIKNRFKKFKANKNIICCSDICIDDKNRKQKATNIQNWWSDFEQQSITMFLDYNIMAKTDIVACYESIYTHSIAWALHEKQKAKENKRDKTLIGNIIDISIQQMRYGQTNGIPQGSVLMDFIAEMVLGYADELLSTDLKNLRIANYKILRYRDDYRIFAKSTEDLNIILKELSAILSELNLKLNTNKTGIYTDIVNGSIKEDKMFWLKIKHQFEQETNIQKKLFILKDFGDNYPNSGQLKRPLTDLSKEDFVKYRYEIKNNYKTICTILCSIWLQNPSSYTQIATIYSKIFDIINNKTKIKNIINKLLSKFRNSPNNTYFEIWIQRALLKFIDIKNESKFQSKLAQIVYSQNNIWDSSWLKPNIFKEEIIDNEKLKNMGKVISFEEFCLFNNYMGEF